ncbi:unnamed protein product [Soboliphyme baturini]|uniref:SGNH domain-containing protein n=1 Tax=Soboliphyme baturini TaxID=241478 RepID=A0A183ILA4_9BILA|nr:unnamed protein product [Soboliphyme baturini]
MFSLRLFGTRPAYQRLTIHIYELPLTPYAFFFWGEEDHPVPPDGRFQLDQSESFVQYFTLLRFDADYPLQCKRRTATNHVDFFTHFAFPSNDPFYKPDFVVCDSYGLLCCIDAVVAVPLDGPSVCPEDLSRGTVFMEYISERLRKTSDQASPSFCVFEAFIFDSEILLQRWCIDACASYGLSLSSLYYYDSCHFGVSGMRGSLADLLRIHAVACEIPEVTYFWVHQMSNYSVFSVYSHIVNTNGSCKARHKSCKPGRNTTTQNILMGLFIEVFYYLFLNPLH